MDVKFYKCMHCGNIAVKVFDAGVPLVCCGEKMVELVAGSRDAALEARARRRGRGQQGRRERRLGGSSHAGGTLDPVHLPGDRQGYQIHPLAPGEAPHAEFVIAEGETPLKVYEHCNLHGLWVTEI